jgi:hypothetical protein
VRSISDANRALWRSFATAPVPKFLKKIQEEPIAALRFIKTRRYRRQPIEKQHLDEEENANFNKGAAQEPKQPAPG